MGICLCWRFSAHQRLQLLLLSADWCHAGMQAQCLHILQFSKEVRKACFHMIFQTLATNSKKFLTLDQTEFGCGLDSALAPIYDSKKVPKVPTKCIHPTHPTLASTGCFLPSKCERCKTHTHVAGSG